MSTSTPILILVAFNSSKWGRGRGRCVKKRPMVSRRCMAVLASFAEILLLHLASGSSRSRVRHGWERQESLRQESLRFSG